MCVCVCLISPRQPPSLVEFTESFHQSPSDGKCYTSCALSSRTNVGLLLQAPFWATDFLSIHAPPSHVLMILTLLYYLIISLIPALLFFAEMSWLLLLIFHLNFISNLRSASKCYLDGCIYKRPRQMGLDRLLYKGVHSSRIPNSRKAGAPPSTDE